MICACIDSMQTQSGCSVLSTCDQSVISQMTAWSSNELQGSCIESEALQKGLGKHTGPLRARRVYRCTILTLAHCVYRTMIRAPILSLSQCTRSPCDCLSPNKPTSLCFSRRIEMQDSMGAPAGVPATPSSCGIPFRLNALLGPESHPSASHHTPLLLIHNIAMHAALLMLCKANQADMTVRIF